MSNLNQKKGYICGDCGYPYGESRPNACTVCGSRNFLYMDEVKHTLKASFKDVGYGVKPSY